eukprot:g5152.t1
MKIPIPTGPHRKKLRRTTHTHDGRRVKRTQLMQRTIVCEASHKEKLSKCKMYIEAYEHEACNNFYMVLETEEKSLVVTERLANGSLSWKENPQNLEDRNSLAKLLFTVDCKENMLLGEVVRHFEELPSDSSLDCRKHYAKALYKFVSGRNLRGKWGGSARRYAAPAPKRGLGMSMGRPEFQASSLTGIRGL